MLETLLLLFTAHLLADFVFQTKGMIRRKKTVCGLLAHTVVVVVATFLVTGSPDPWIYLSVGISHALIDCVKVHLLEDNIWTFAGDQLLHIVVIVTLAVLLPGTAEDGWLGKMSTDAQLFACRALAVLSGLILVINVGGVVVGKLLAPFTPAVSVQAGSRQSNAGENADNGMQKAGRFIGRLERGLIFLFLLLGQPEGVGLMLAAKSILRFADSHARTRTEYVIIGTMLSFGWAIVAAILTRVVVNHWAS